MYQLLLAVCINGEAALCMDRRLPLGEDMNMMRCMREGLVHAQKWADAHPDLELKSWRCITEQKEPKPLEDFAVEEIADGVFVHLGRHAIPAPANLNDTSNIGFIIGDEAVAVVDAGGSAAVARALLFHIRERTDLPIKYLILTHMHPDHVLGAPVFREAGATVIGHRKLARALKARADTYTDNLRRLMGDVGFEGSAVILPDEEVDGMRKIDLGGRVLTLVAHPTAHTDNDLTVEDEETGIWFLGDLLFAGHTPALDGSVTGWTRLMDTLADRQAAGVVPGHGPALLDWPDGLDAMQGYLKSMTVEVRASRRLGVVRRIPSPKRHYDLQGAGMGIGRRSIHRWHH
jgi:quinoprotein relay system zinc metallohydrolase 2